MSRASCSRPPDTSGSRRRPSRRPSCSPAAPASPRDIVQKEMYSFDDGGGRSLTLRPEGTAPVCRAYVQHGMHKLPAPGARSTTSRASSAPSARRPAATASSGSSVSRRSAPTIPRSTPRRSSCSRRFSSGSASPACGCGSRASAAPRAAPPIARSWPRYLRANADRLAPVVRERIELNPLRAFDSDDPGTREVMAGRAAPARPARRATTPSTSPQVRELLDAPRVAYEIDSDARARPRLLHAHAVRVHQRRARRAVGGGGGGRYDGLVEQLGGPPTPGIGWAAGIERIMLASDARPLGATRRSISTSRFEAARADAFETLTAARAAGLAAQMELAGRSLKGQLQAGRAPRRALLRRRRG